MLLQTPEEINATVSSTVSVCVGDEWYRYPSSFFLPGPAYRLQFVKSSFDGMLPLAFNASQVRPAMALRAQQAMRTFTMDNEAMVQSSGVSRQLHSCQM